MAAIIIKTTTLGYSMTSNGVFESQANSEGNLAGVYEHDNEVGYFYLYQVSGHEGSKVLGSIHISNGPFLLDLSDVEIRWDSEEAFVGLFIQGHLRAAFDVRSQMPFLGE